MSKPAFLMEKPGYLREREIGNGESLNRQRILPRQL